MMEYADAYSYRPAYNPAFLARVQEKRRQEQQEAQQRKLAEEAKRREMEAMRREMEAKQRQEAMEAARRRLEEAQKAAEKAKAEVEAAAIREREVALADQASMTRKSVSEARQIIMEVAAAHGVTYGAILGRSRARKLVAARHEAIYEVRRRRPHLSLPQIGKIFGRDHTTCLYALEKHGVKSGK